MPGEPRRAAAYRDHGGSGAGWVRPPLTPLRASRGTTALGRAPQPSGSPPGPRLRAHEGKLYGSQRTHKAASRSPPGAVPAGLPRQRSPRGRAGDAGEAPAHSPAPCDPRTAPFVLPPPQPSAHLSSGGCASCPRCRGSPLPGSPVAAGRARAAPLPAARRPPSAALPPALGFIGGGGRGGGNAVRSHFGARRDRGQAPLPARPPGRGEPPGSRRGEGRGREGDDEVEAEDAAAPVRSKAAATRLRPAAPAGEHQHLCPPAGHRRHRGVRSGPTLPWPRKPPLRPSPRTPPPPRALLPPLGHGRGRCGPGPGALSLPCRGAGPLQPRPACSPAGRPSSPGPAGAQPAPVRAAARRAAGSASQGWPLLRGPSGHRVSLLGARPLLAVRPRSPGAGPCRGWAPAAGGAGARTMWARQRVLGL